MQETWVWSLDWEDPLEKRKLPTPVFWPVEFHGRYSPWGCKELDITERLSDSHTRKGIHGWFYVWVGQSHKLSDMILYRREFGWLREASLVLENVATLEALLLGRHDLNLMVKWWGCPRTDAHLGRQVCPLDAEVFIQVQKYRNHLTSQAHSSLREINLLQVRPVGKAPLDALFSHVFCVSKRFGWPFLKGLGVILQPLPLHLSAGHHCDLLPLSLTSGNSTWFLEASGLAWLSSFLSTDCASSAGLESGHRAALGWRSPLLDQTLLRLF